MNAWLWGLVAWAAPLSPEDVVAEALRSHPAVVAARAGVDAAEGARAGVATLLENPELQVGASPLGDLTFVQLQQPLSLTGEGWRARREASAWEGWAEAAVAVAEITAAADARAAWVEAATCARRVGLLEEGLALAAGLRGVVEARAAVGEGSGLDVALARAAEARAAAAVMAARRDEAAARLALARFHPGAAVDGVEGVPADAVPAAAGGPAVRADVAAAESAVAAREAGVARARAAAVPSLGVGLQFQSDGGELDLGPMLTWAPPLWARNQAAIAEAGRALRVARAEGAQVVAAAAAEVSVGDALVAALEGDVADRRDGDAALREAAAAVTAAVAAGELDVVDATRAQAELVEGRLAAVEIDRALVLARLSALAARHDRSLLGSGGEVR
jgi:outer membrane protein TolC